MTGIAAGCAPGAGAVTGVRARPSPAHHHHRDVDRIHLPVLPRRGIVAARLRDLLERLEWVIRNRFEELPDTLVAALHAAGVPCDRAAGAAELIAQLRAGQPESRAAAS